MKGDRYLRRLDDEAYQGRACVHWTMTMVGRRTGWLTREFHASFREILVHTLARYRLTCPAYCLMPDHFHVLWLGLARESDQRRAARFFRKHVNSALSACSLGSSGDAPAASEGGTSPPIPHASYVLQKQAHDRVLRSHEREKNALRKVAYYIMANPVRNESVEEWEQWPYLGGMIVGYPFLDPRDDEYWETFWTLYERLSDSSPI